MSLPQFLRLGDKHYSVIKKRKITKAAICAELLQLFSDGNFPAADRQDFANTDTSKWSKAEQDYFLNGLRNLFGLPIQ